MNAIIDDRFLNNAINLEWLDDYLEITKEEATTRILVLGWDGVKEEQTTYENEILYLVHENKRQRLGDLDCLSNIQAMKNKDLNFYPTEYYERWLDENVDKI